MIKTYILFFFLTTQKNSIQELTIMNDFVQTSYRINRDTTNYVVYDYPLFLHIVYSLQYYYNMYFNNTLEGSTYHLVNI